MKLSLSENMRFKTFLYSLQIKDLEGQINEYKTINVEYKAENDQLKSELTKVIENLQVH